MKKITQNLLASLMIVSMITFSGTTHADNVDPVKAAQVGAYFMASQFGNKSITADNVKLVYEIPNMESDATALYVFNTPGNQGFVVVSGSECISPIIAYSTDGAFDPNNIPPNMMYWLNEQVQLIVSAQNGGFQPLPAEKAAWKQLTDKELPYFGAPAKAITRLLTSTWNQEPIYNEMCPLDEYGRRCVTGCVATAMAQIIYYWKYPYVGQNSYYYYWNGQRLQVDFGNSYYNYDVMTDALSDTSSQEAIDAVAQLSYHCGVSVNMDYGFDGSGTTSDKVPKALRKYFKYVADSLKYVERESSNYYNPNSQTSPNYKDTAWVNLIISDLMKKRPVYYAGHTASNNGDVHAGHAFVCDGYNDVTKTLHFNWGWGGRGDCWCNVYTSNLRIAFMNMNYTINHRIVTGITPPNDSISFVGIREVENPFTTAIYPNPANEQVTVSYHIDSPADMQIFDITGRQVETVTLTPYSSQTTLPVSHYRPGVYICRLNGHSMKFVVQ